MSIEGIGAYLIVGHVFGAIASFAHSLVDDYEYYRKNNGRITSFLKMLGINVAEFYIYVFAWPIMLLIGFLENVLEIPVIIPIKRMTKRIFKQYKIV